MFSLFIKNTQNSYIYEAPFASLSFTEELNKGSDFQASFNYSQLDEIAKRYGTDCLFLLTGGFREIWLNKDTNKLFYGAITDFDMNKTSDSELGINIAAVNFFNLFNKRRTGAKRIFTSTDAAQIAWTLINESQTSDSPYSDLGITAGLLPTVVNRDQTYRFANIKEEIINLSNNNLNSGFDFEIDTLKKFNVYYPIKGSIRSNIVLDDANIMEWRIRKPMILSLTNKIYVTGDGMNDDVLNTTRTSDSSYRTVFGTLEDVLSARDVTVLQTLQDKGDKYLLENQSPRVELTISHIDDSPDMLNYSLGDTLKINIPEANIVNQYMRVYKRSFTLDNGELPIVTLTLK